MHRASYSPSLRQDSAGGGTPRLSLDARMETHPRQSNSISEIIGATLRKRRVLEACKSFVPIRVLSHCVRMIEKYPDDDDNQREVVQNRSASLINADLMEGAVLFADVSGFTALSELLKDKYDALVKAGEKPEWTAPEMLCQKLNQFLTKVIDEVYNYGGDVIKFSGDAVTVLFISGGSYADVDHQHVSATIESATLRAVACSEAIHQSTAEFAPELTLHMGIGAGKLTGTHVGGRFDRMEYILAGHPMTQVSLAEPLAVSGETGISPEAHNLCIQKLQADGLYDGDLGELVSELPDSYYEQMPIKTTAGAAPPEVQRKKRKEEHRAAELKGFRMLKRNLKLNVKPVERVDLGITDDTLLKRYIPGAVVTRLTHREESGRLAEMLPISVVFVCIEGINLGVESQDDVSNVKQLGQRLMLRVQETIYHWEGSVNKLMVDDKGLLVVCAFGLPPMHHGDDPWRAVCAARDIIKAVQSVEATATTKVGVSTGRAFCGIVGHAKLRREYTVMGSVVNLCARLMMAAEPNTVMISEETEQTVSGKFELEKFKIHMKGIGDRNCYKPTGKKKKAKAKKSKMNYDGILDDLNWGRREELDELQSILGRLKVKKGGLILITGERGHGKTFMLDKVLEKATEPWANMKVLQSTGKEDSAPKMAHKTIQDFRKLFAANGETYIPAYESSLYRAWREIIDECVKTGASESSMEELEWVAMALDEYAECEISIDEAKVQLTNFRTSSRDLIHAKPETLGNILLTILQKFCAQFGPTLVKIHLQRDTSIATTVCEAESWDLVKRVSECRCGIIVVVGTRSFSYTDREMNTVKELISIAEADMSLMELGDFDWTHCLKFAAEIMSCPDTQIKSKEDAYRVAPQDLPEELKSFIFQAASGNPKQIIELIDPLLHGYAKESDYISPVANDSSNWSKPVVEIEGNHCVRLSIDSLDRYPWPKKIVGYLEQQYQQLQDHEQYLLHVASSFEHGFTMELLKPFEADGNINHVETVYRLLQQGLLKRLDEEDFDEETWATIKQLDCTAEEVFVFSSVLLQRRLSMRIVQEEREFLADRRRSAKVRCRWVRLRRYWLRLLDARRTLATEGYQIIGPGESKEEELAFNNKRESSQTPMTPVLTVFEEDTVQFPSEETPPSPKTPAPIVEKPNMIPTFMSFMAGVGMTLGVIGFLDTNILQQLASRLGETLQLW
eukprot:m.137830 g.137830  ORF g.137830 m.137830 type:complete len:1191 (+) comp14763_c0_seq1:324-3896(+)